MEISSQINESKFTKFSKLLLYVDYAKTHKLFLELMAIALTRNKLFCQYVIL